MDSHNFLAWQRLPQWLLDPLMEQVISAAEAEAIWDEWLQTPPGEFRPAPPHLHQACARLHLWTQEVDKRRQ